MKTFKIMFERKNGTTGIQEINAPNLTGAINWFNENYRYRNGEIVSICEVT